MSLLLRLIFSAVAFLIIDASAAIAKDPLNIFVSIIPQKYFVNRIAGDLAEVDVLVEPGKSPHTYSLTPAKIKSLSRADVYFRIGVAFENGFIHKIDSIAKNIKIVDCRKGIQLREMKADIHERHHEDEEHGHDHEDYQGPGHQKSEDHVHQGKDPHTWMDPNLVKVQAKTILSELIFLNPYNADFFRKNYKSFVKDLDDLHHSLTNSLAPFKGEKLFVFHPAFGYLADAYGLHQVSVESMGKAPKGKNLSAFIKFAKKEKARIIFVQPQFDNSMAKKIASAIKGQVIPLDPLAKDYLGNMITLVNTITKNLNPK